MKNLKIAMLGVAIVAVMVVIVTFSPTLYKIFCQITGYGGTTQQSERPSDSDGVGDYINRVTGNQTSEYGNAVISFDSNINGDLPWDFNPQAGSMEIPIGETAVAYYRVTNNGENETIGQAVFNVTPHEAGQYFVKIDCFCFTEQVFKAGETRDLPVDFYIDPEIKNDPDVKDLNNITLSYTFFSLFDEEIPEMPEMNHGKEMEHDTEMKHGKEMKHDTDGMSH